MIDDAKRVNFDNTPNRILSWLSQLSWSPARERVQRRERLGARFAYPDARTVRNEEKKKKTMERRKNEIECDSDNIQNSLIVFLCN